MSEPGEIQFSCIGCGAMNSADAEVCSGCGHRFAGPKGGPLARPLPQMAPEPEAVVRIDDRYSLPSNKTTSLLGCLQTAIGICVAAVFTIIAFVVAFFVTCLSLSGPGNDSLTMSVSAIAGVAAAGLVVALSFWIVSFFRSDRK